MKLKEILTTAQRHNILESIRFGNKEIQSVLQNNERLRIGFEFEFHMNEEQMEGSYDDLYYFTLEDFRNFDSHLVDQIERDLESHKIDAIEDNYDFEDTMDNIERVFISKKYINDLKEYKEWFLNSYESWIDENEELTPQYYEDQNKIINTFNSFTEIFENDFFNDIDTNLDNLKNIINEIEIDGNDEAIFDPLQDIDTLFIDDISDFLLRANEDKLKNDIKDDTTFMLEKLNEFFDDSRFDDTIEKIETFCTDLDNRYSQFWMLKDNIMDNVSVPDEELRENVIDHIQRNDLEEHFVGMDEGDAVQKIDNDIDEYDLREYIKTVTTDSSVEYGIEIITDPLKPKEIELAIKGILHIIEDNGYTSSETGLHMNVSLTDDDFERNNFNLLKYFLLISEEHITSEFNRENNAYANSLKNSLKQVYIVKRAIEEFVDEGIKGLEEFTENILVKNNVKYLGINLTNFTQQSRYGNRIEVRYPGDDYLDDKDKILWHSYRILYILMAAFDNNFEERKYINSLLEMWDEISREVLDIDFTKAVQMYKKDYNLSY